ncbi:MAG: hypothetical protein E7108_01895 [Bacteroidales bacterium]|jgi:predicted thioredoxin/glutaredoxin|nr:hypothetical protein [Bacteroidales bacterium]
MTVSEALISSVSYPVDIKSVEKICIERELDVDASFDKAMAKSKAFRLAQADVYMFVATAHNISEADISVSTSSLISKLISKANAIYGEYGEQTDMAGEPTVTHRPDWE